MKRIKDLSIKIKLLVSILIVTLIPLMTAGYLSYESSYGGIYKVTKQDLNYIVKIKSDSIATVTEDSEITSEEDKVIRQYLDDIKENYYKANGMDGYGFVLDENGITMYHPDQSVIGKDLTSTDFISTIVNDPNESGYIEYEWQGETKVAAYHKLPNGWSFAVSSYLKDMMKPVEPIKKEMFLISILGSFFAILVGAFAVSQITKPIKSVVSAMKQAEEGDLTVQVPIHSSDEVGQISIMYNSMITRLKEILSNINDASQQVAASSQELSASANENTRASEQIANAAEEISRGSQDQVNRVGEVVKSIHEISSSITNTAQNVGKVKEGSDTANQYAKEGAENLGTVIKEMNDITDKVQKTETVIRALGKQSESIMGIITTISDISEQTNLLALNAAIEAARAGEQGKSFAVVAGEVRKLAEQSRNSASEIADLIVTINDEIKEATVMMEESTKAVTVGESVVKIAGESFTKIESSIQNVNREMDSLNQMIETINKRASSIVVNSDEISKVAEVAAADTEEVAAAAEEQMATMEEINSASHVLTDMADHLQEQVSRFKVK